MKGLTQYDGLGLAELVRKKEVTPAELVEAAAASVEAVNPKLNAVIGETLDYAREHAAAVPMDGMFAGVPYMMKELATLWAGIPQTNASRYFKDFVPPIEHEIVSRLKRAGFLLVGRTNAPEFGWALTTEPEMYGRTHNPWRDDITPGGSSGGSAAAVASRMVAIAEASDAAGSIRVPASNCGLVGLKPSRGRATLWPVGADFFYGAAHFLCVSRTVRDTAAFLDVTSGEMPGDPYNTPAPERPWLQEVGRDPGRLKIAFTVSDPTGRDVHPEVADAVRGTAKTLEGLGHDVVEHDLAADLDALWRTYTRITAVQTAMVFQNMAELIGHEVRQEEVSPTMWAIIQRGHEVSGVQHSNDVELFRLGGREIAMDLAPYDLFITPVLTNPPRGFGYWDMSEPDIDAYNAKWTDGIFMFTFNVSGQPGMAIPVKVTGDGSPVGVQLVGRPCDEATVIRVASQLEAASPWIERQPPVCAT